MDSTSPVILSDDATQVVAMRAEWLSAKLGAKVCEVSVEPLVNGGGLTGSMQIATLKAEDGAVIKSLVVKSILTGEKLASSKTLGLAREALFYKHLSADLRDKCCIPEVIYAWSDMETGAKIIVMEDLKSATQSGYFFGAGSPLNAGKDLDKLVADAGGAAGVDIARLAFRSAAELHAQYWNKTEELASLSWLTKSQWFKGAGKEKFLKSQELVAGKWAEEQAKMGASDYGVKWSKEVLDLMDASISKISWESFQNDWVVSPSLPLTLVHGDFHPANMMYLKGEDGGEKLYIMDWELVGIGSGPQELGQYMISHASPELRRACEEELLQEYHSDLTRKGVDLAWKTCKEEYVMGGVEKWLWFLPHLCSLPAPMLQYFHDQVLAFVQDHNVTTEKVGQPRASS